MQRKKPQDFLQLGLCLDTMNNEFAVISFREKQRKRSLQTWEIRQRDSMRNCVERIRFFKNKIRAAKNTNLVPQMFDKAEDMKGAAGL